LLGPFFNAFNSSFRITRGANSAVISLLSSNINYTPTQIVDLIKTKIAETNLGTIDVFYESTSNFFGFFAVNPPLEIDFTISDIGDILGFRKQVYYGNLIQGPLTAVLTRPDYLSIYIDKLNKNEIVSTESNPIVSTFLIPVTEGKFVNNIFQENSNYIIVNKSINNPITLQKFRVTIYEEQLRRYNNGNSNISMMIEYD
jgi:hypothetical protein